MWSTHRIVVLEFICIVFFAACYILPPLVATHGMSVRMDTDYMAHFPIYQYIVKELEINKTIPQTHPYVGTGMPIVGDPLSSVLNPFLMVPLILFGIGNGFRVYIGIITLFAGCSMWLLLWRFGVPRIIRTWGSVLYMVSGTGAAIWAAGHIEKSLSFALFPLLFFAGLPHRMSARNMIVVGVVLTLMWFSGGLYSVWYGCMFLGIIRVYYFFRYPKERPVVLWNLIAPVVLFFLLGFPKLYEYVLRVAPILSRAIPNYALGSIHAWYLPILFINPFQVLFYDRPSLQRIVGMHYNWYEYYAFISPLPFIFFARISSFFKHPLFRVCVILCIAGALHLALRYPYSPFYRIYTLVPAIQIFRVPQRIVLPLTSIVIAMLSLAAGEWISSIVKRRILLAGMLGSIVWTMAVSQKTLYAMYEPERVEGKYVAQQLRQRDASSYYVALIPCCLQYYFVEQQIPVLNYYYGWKMKEAAKFKFVNRAASVELLPETPRPTYIITDTSVHELGEYGEFMRTQEYIVWKTDVPTIVPATYE